MDFLATRSLDFCPPKRAFFHPWEGLMILLPVKGHLLQGFHFAKSSTHIIQKPHKSAKPPCTLLLHVPTTSSPHAAFMGQCGGTGAVAESTAVHGGTSRVYHHRTLQSTEEPLGSITIGHCCLHLPAAHPSALLIIQTQA